MRSGTHSFLKVSAGIFFILFIALAFAVFVPSPVEERITEIDIYFSDSLSALQALPFLYWIMLAATFLGNPQTVVVLGIVACVFLGVCKCRNVASVFLGGVLLSEAVSLTTKLLLGRARPSSLYFHVTAYGFAFPSGHALIAVVFYGFAGFLAARALKNRLHRYFVRILTTFLVFMIGFSRVFLEVHWVSDVIGGWLLGGAFLLAMILTLRTRGDFVLPQQKRSVV